MPKKQQVQIAVCDGRHFESVGYKKLQDALNMGSERAIRTLLSISVGGLVDMGLTVYRAMKTGKLLKGPTMKFAMALNKTYEYAMDRIPNSSQLLRYGLAYYLGDKLGDLEQTGANFVDNMGKIEKFLTNITDSDLGRIQDTVELRNLSMASNIRSSLLMLDQIPESNTIKYQFTHEDQKPETFFFMGSGHLRSKEYFERGPQYCETALGGKIKTLVSDIYWELSDLKKSGNIEQYNSVLKDFILNTSPLNYPITSFMNSEGYIHTKIDTPYYSPRALLWEFMSKNQNQFQNDEVWMDMVNKLIQEDIVYQKLVKGVVPGLLTKAEDVRMVDKIIKVRDTQNEYEYRYVDGIPLLYEPSTKVIH